MNKIDFSNIGGFPLEQDSLDFLQNGYGDLFTGIANMIGDKRILAGVKVVNGNVTDGYITYNGEVLKFVGAIAGPNVIVKETIGDATFEDTTIKGVYKTRFATIGSIGAVQFPFSDLRPVSFGSPLGIPEMFAGAIAKMPENYGLCDGTILNVTDYPSLFDVIGNLHGGDGVNTFALPNLKGMFIAGYDAGDADYNIIGKKGGEKAHLLGTNELPQIDFTPKLYYGRINWGNKNSNEVLVKENSDKVTGSGKPNVPTPNVVGGNQPHENRPPFYTLAYIIRLK